MLLFVPLPFVSSVCVPTYDIHNPPLAFLTDVAAPFVSPPPPLFNKQIRKRASFYFFTNNSRIPGACLRESRARTRIRNDALKMTGYLNGYNTKWETLVATTYCRNFVDSMAVHKIARVFKNNADY